MKRLKETDKNARKYNLTKSITVTYDRPFQGPGPCTIRVSIGWENEYWKTVKQTHDPRAKAGYGAEFILTVNIKKASPDTYVTSRLLPLLKKKVKALHFPYVEEPYYTYK